MKSCTFSRRAILRGIGAAVALPLMDVVPAFAQLRPCCHCAEFVSDFYHPSNG